MDGIKRVSGNNVGAHHASSTDHRRLQKSTTLNRRFVKKPVAKPKLSVSASAAAASMRRAQAAQAGQKASATTSRQLIAKRGINLQPVAKNAAVAQGAQQAQKQAAQAGQAQRGAAAQGQAAINKAIAQKAQAGQAQAGARAAQQQANAKQAIQRNQVAQVANARMAARKAEPVRMTAQEIKEREIQKALRKVAEMDQPKAQFGIAKEKKLLFKRRKLAIASAAAAICLLVLGYLVYVNMPDISARVAAMQAGIDKSFPSYTPSTYRLDGLVKEENGLVTMNFKNANGNTFMITEQKSSWDSNAVLGNYVKKEWGSNYSIAKGQGLTIYINGSNAVWVNGGVLYIIEDNAGVLSASDLHDIAVSI